jgi:tetratricopeptide (TPR) repeat protein
MPWGMTAPFFTPRNMTRTMHQPCRDWLPFKRLGQHVGLLAGMLLAPLGHAQVPTHTPTDDAVVVQRLTYNPTTAERSRQRALRTGPANLPLALAAARDAITRARRLGDPRDLGLAQAALQPWWADANAPPPVVLLRATVLQSQHHFDAALQDLGNLLDPNKPVELAVRQQAWLTRAAVLQAQGQLVAAHNDCAALEASTQTTPTARSNPQASTRMLARACLAELQSLQGQSQAATRAFAVLAALAAESQDNADTPWLALLRAEHAERIGSHTEAAKHYRAATDGSPDVYAVCAYADWLLAQGKPGDALRVLDRIPADADALLLRRAIALKRLRDPQAAAHADTLRARFSASQRPVDAKPAKQPGDLRAQAAAPAPQNLHAREEARLALDVDGDAQRAWALAQSNWATQKEPADAVLYVRAAVVAQAQPQAQALVASLQAKGWQDVRLSLALQGKP